MAINVKGGQPNAVVAKATVSFVSAGINASNVSNIFLVDAALRSFDPKRTLNAITMFEEGKGYYINALQDIDLTQWIGPPFESGSGIALEDGGLIIPES